MTTYDSYVNAEHQLFCAHAQRELAAVADTTGAGTDWCWATQASDALVAMRKLVTDAIAVGADALDPEALNQHIQLYRSAARIDITSTAARSNKIMRKHHALTLPRLPQPFSPGRATSCRSS